MELYIVLSVIAVLMLVSLLSSKISSKINMPCLLLFLIVGFVWGMKSPMNHTVSPVVANYIGSIALAFILFSGGFDTDWESVKSVFKTGGLLSSIGVLMTAVITGSAMYALSRLFPDGSNHQLSFAWCLLLGSIISSTDAAAVFSILRSKSVSLKGKLQPLLEFESGSNDPMAAFLTLFFLEMVIKESRQNASPDLLDYAMIIPTFPLQMSVGILFGAGVGAFFVWLYNKIDFEYNGLYYALSVVAVLLAYGVPYLLPFVLRPLFSPMGISIPDSACGNGYMAVYAAGMYMGNRKFVFHNGVGKFYDGLGWIMQVVLFTMLGILAYIPGMLPDHIFSGGFHLSAGMVESLKNLAVIATGGLVISAILMFIARPVSVYTCMLGSEYSIQERTLVSWVGLRGGAPIMLATFPLLAMPSSPNTRQLFSVVFFTVITSVLLQGMTIMPLAKLLHLDAPLKKTPRMPLSFEETGNRDSASQELAVPKSLEGKTLAQLKMPEGVLVLMIRREEQVIVPRGDTALEEGDILTIMGTPSAIRASEQMLSETQKTEN